MVPNSEALAMAESHDMYCDCWDCCEARDLWHAEDNAAWLIQKHLPSVQIQPIDPNDNRRADKLARHYGLYRRRGEADISLLRRCTLDVLRAHRGVKA